MFVDNDIIKVFVL